MIQQNNKLQVMDKTAVLVQQSKPDKKKIFRTLTDSESFYFYRAIGEPLGEKADSLLDFLNKIQRIDVLSIAFHFYRGDFEQWVKNTLGDPDLASQLTVSERPTLKGEVLRNYVSKRVKARFSYYNVKKS